jgi:exodeoxyribonuclease III
MAALTKLEVVSWNIDGLARTFNGRAAPLSEMHRVLGEPAVLCLQEVRIKPDDAPLIAQLRDALPGYACGYSLCADPRNVTFRGGRAYGVATYVRDELAPLWLERQLWDREGRLVVCELPRLRLAIANVYAVNGTGKPYFDHELGRLRGDRHQFKLRFQQHLLELFARLSERGLRLLLIGDWNVSRSVQDVHPRLRSEAPHARARAMFNDQFMPQLDLVDAFRELHPDARAFTWFDRVAARYGRPDAARVDYALLSRELLSDVKHCEVAEALAPQLGSDHAPVKLTLALRRA